MNEEEFVRSVDCAFPYGDVERRSAVLREAATISANAELMVLHEILCPPSSVVISPLDQAGMVEEWLAVCQHSWCREIGELGLYRLRGWAPAERIRDLVALAKCLTQAWNIIAIVEWFSDGAVSDQEIDALVLDIQSVWSDPGGCIRNSSKSAD
jgi:hypothetical protein